MKTISDKTIEKFIERHFEYTEYFLSKDFKENSWMSKSLDIELSVLLELKLITKKEHWNLIKRSNELFIKYYNTEGDN